MAGKTITNKVIFKLDVDGKGLSNSINAVAQEAVPATNKVSNNIGKIANNAKGAGMAMTLGLTLPIVAAGKAALTAGMDFEQGMANIKAVTNASAEDMDKFGTMIRDIAKTTPYTTSEVALAVEELSKAGLTTAQILEGALYGSLTLAAAGEIDLGEAANLAARALITFKDDNLSVAEAADIMVGAANASTTSVGELGSSLEMVSVVAATAGMSFEDVATGLAVFAQNGMAGSDAGTSLKTMLMNLNPQTKKASDLMKDLGIITADGKNQFYDLNGNLKDLAGIAQVVQDAFQGMGTEARLSAMRIIFGQDAIRGASVLYESGAEGIRDMAAAMAEIEAQKVAEEKWDTLGNKFKKLKNNAADLAIMVSERLIPALSDMVDWATDAMKKLGEMPKETQDFILGLLGIIAAAGPVLLIFGNIVDVASKLKGILSFLGITTLPALGTALAVGGAVIVGLIMMKDIFTDLYKNSEGFKKSLDGVVEQLKNIAVESEPMKNALKYLYDIVSGSLKEAIDWFAQNTLPAVTDALKAFNELVGDGSDEAWNLKDAADGVARAIDFFSTTVKLAMAPSVLLINTVSKLFEWWSKLNKAIQSAVGWMREFFNISGDTPKAGPQGNNNAFGVQSGGSQLYWEANGGFNRPGAKAIVGEAGPELLTVGYSGAAITPLTGAAKARNVEQAFGGSNVFNISVEGGWDNADRIASRVADSINLILGNRGVNYVR